MAKHITIEEVRKNVEYTLERMKSQRKEYSLYEINKLFECCDDEYSRVYAQCLESPNCINKRKLKSLKRRKNLLVYIKYILQLTGSRTTKGLPDDLNLDRLSVRVLQKIDIIGYRIYVLNKKNMIVKIKK